MFRKSTEQSRQNRAATETMASGGAFSILGADVVITGNIAASADLHIDGRIDGDITCAALVQGEGGMIVGAVTADSARLAGKVHGSISAGTLVIIKTAHIEGDVHYDQLTIEQGAQVDGRFCQRAAASVTAPKAVKADGGVLDRNTLDRGMMMLEDAPKA